MIEAPPRAAPEPVESREQRPDSHEGGPGGKRARHPHRTRRAVLTGIVGVVVLVGLFAAYLFSVSFLTESRAQAVLLGQFKSALTQYVGQGSEPPIYRPVGLLQLPSLGVQKVIVQGIGSDQTKQGPGHDPSTPLPGQAGNVVIVGRRATFGAPFLHVDGLRPHDPVVVFTRQGRFVYRVTGLALQPLGSATASAPTTDARLTLITASPAYRWSRELVVTAKLDGKPLASATNIAPRSAGEEVGKTTGANPLAGILLWGEIFVAAVVAAFVLYRRWSLVATFLITTPIMVTSLYLLFENLARVLPPTA
jgi:sortase A